MSVLSELNSKNYFEVKSNLSWDEYFMFQAIMASYKSKDPNTKVGCVFVDQNNHQLSMGYNGFVAGIDESRLPWGNDRNVDYEHQKYGYVVHSEANAVLHAKTALESSKIYVTLFPCEECAKMLATKKVTEVIYLSDKYDQTSGNLVAKKILSMAKIKFRQFIPKVIVAEKFKAHLDDLLEKL